jgi:hypothetical protein
LYIRYNDGNSSQWVRAENQVGTGGSFLPLAGGTMGGPLTLAGNATQPLHAVPLQQLTSTTAGFLPLTGGTVSGPTFVHYPMTWTPSTNQGALTIYGDMSGTMGAVGGVTPFGVIVTSNSVDSTGNPGASFFASSIQHNFGGTKGGQGCLRIVQTQTSDLADTAGVFINPVVIELGLNHNAGGFGNGLAFAPQVGVYGTGWGLIEAEEPAVMLTAGASVVQAYVTTSVWNAAAHATQSDAFDCFVTGAGNGAAPRAVWQIGRNDSQWPVDRTTGWLLTTVQQQNNNPGNTARWPQACAGGFDLWKINFGTAAFRSSGIVIEDTSVKVGVGRLYNDSNGVVLDSPGTWGWITSYPNGGSGYQINDQVYDGVGGIATVSAVSSGAITAASYTRAPVYFGTGPTTAAVTGGSGSGAVLGITWYSGKNEVTLNPSGGPTVVSGTLGVAGVTTLSGGAIVSAALSANAGLYLGSNVATGPTDFSKHISFYGGNQYGMCVTGGQLNYGGTSSIIHAFNSSGTATATITATGGLKMLQGIGLFNGTPVTAKPTLTGAKGSNAALASVIAALVAYGMATDTTTA